MVRYSMKFVPWTDKKAVAADLKAIYGADTLEMAEANLEHFDKTWGTDYEPPRDCRRLNILREYNDENTTLHPRD